MSYKKPSLTEREEAIVEGCLRAAVEGPFFEDWEFLTLFGVERSQVADVLSRWPNIAWCDEVDRVIVIGSANHLIGYPHGMDDLLRQYVDATPEEIRQLLVVKLAL